MENGKITLETLDFGCKTLDVVLYVDIKSIPTKSLNTLLQYGTRRINDAFNSAKKEEMTKDELQALWDSLIQKMMNGELGDRVASYNPDSEFKKYVIAVLKQLKTPSKVLKEINGLNVSEGLKIVFPKKTKEELVEIESKLRAKFEKEQKAREQLLELF